MKMKEKRNKIKIAALLVLSLFFMVWAAGMQVNAGAEESDPEYIEVDGINYTLDKENQTAIVSYCTDKNNEDIKEKVIPSEISFEDKIYTVTEIGGGAFSDALYLERIILPATVRKIGSAAFIDCSALREINLPKGIKTIEMSTFMECVSLEEIVIPDTVEVMESAVFLGCSKLKKIKIPESVVEIKGACFSQCTALEEIEFPEGLTTIQGGTFVSCSSLKKVILPKSMKTLYSDTFTSCQSLEQIVIPEGVETIDDEFVHYCDNLKYVYYPKHLEEQFSNVKAEIDVRISYIVNEDGTVSLTVENILAGTTDIQLPSDLYGCEIVSITGPEGVDLPVVCTKHHLGAYAKDVKEHWRVCSVCKKEIKENHGYGNGTEVCVCNYVPFEISEQSKDVTLESDYPSASLMVKIKKTLGTENVSCQWYEDGKEIHGATNTSYTIPAGKVAGVYRYTCKISFEGYSQTTKVMTVTVNAPKKETVTKPEKKVPVKGKKYKDDNNKATYKVTNARTDGKGTVEYVKPVNKKKSVVAIPATVKIGGVTYKVTSIAKNAFKNNKYIKRLTIEKNVEKIGARAFYGCKKLKNITIKTTKLKTKKIGTAAFKKTPSSAKIKVPKKKLKAYKTMFLKKGVSKKAKIRKL